MASFKDTAGRDWTVDITVQTLKRIKSALNIDLLDNQGGKGILGQMAADPILVCDILYVACQDQAEKAGVSDEDFGSALGGDALQAGIDALLEAFIGFFPNRAQRAALGRAWEKMGKLTEMAIEAVQETLDSGQLEAQMKTEIGSQLTGGMKSIGTPASSESTPVP